MSKVAIIGFGEAGQAFVKGWGRERQFDVAAFDIKPDKEPEYEVAGMAGCATLKQALEGADAIISLVTADQAHVAAVGAAQHIAPDAFYFDGNSCAPETKKKSEQVVNSVAGRYIDMAIMAPVHPALNKVSVLLSGPHVETAQEIIALLDLSAKHVKGPVGTASAIKMTRSIMMKGLEALMLECVLAGRKAGVEDIVLDSLEETYPGFGWKDRAAYMFERVMTHGTRRAAEMREVAKTVDDLGLNAGMAHATVDWHQAIGDLGLETMGFEQKDHKQLADILLKELAKRAKR